MVALAQSRKLPSKTFRRAISPAQLVTMTIDSPVGPLLLGATETDLHFVEFVDGSATQQIAQHRKRCLCPVLPGCNALMMQTVAQLGEYFAGQRKEFTIPMEYPGTDFQERVWQELCNIPYGQTCSYQALSQAVTAAPNASRAVGRANGTNRIAILIPCHRVVNKDGSLGGYGGGLTRKAFLLELERQQLLT